jgi:plasmid stabilization system protein ParE
MVKRIYKVIWDDEAKASLKRIYNYIKNRQSVERARMVRDEIKELGKSLGYMPHKYRTDDNLEDEPGDYRFKAIWSYKIIYETTEDAVVILDVFHTSRDPQDIKDLKKE